jgi:hypothetical protein
MTRDELLQNLQARFSAKLAETGMRDEVHDAVTDPAGVAQGFGLEALVDAFEAAMQYCEPEWRPYARTVFAEYIGGILKRENGDTHD